MIEITRICDICKNKFKQEVRPDHDGTVTYSVEFTCSDCMLIRVRAQATDSK